MQTFAEKHVRPVDGDNLANQLLKTLTKAIEGIVNVAMFMYIYLKTQRKFYFYIYIY